MISLALPNAGLAWPVLLAWPPLLVLIRQEGVTGTNRMKPWRRRFLWGWLMGVGYHAVTFRWIAFTLGEMTNIPSAAGYGAMVAFWLWHGIAAGIFAALCEPIRQTAENRAPGSGPVALGVLWVTIEWVTPALFPFTLGHAFWHVGPVATVQALTGAPGLSFVVMTFSAWAAGHWLRTVRPPKVDLRPPGFSHKPRRISLETRWMLGAVSPLLVFGVIWFGVIHQTPVRRVVRAGIIQVNHSIEEKKEPTMGNRVRMMRRLLKLLGTVRPGDYEILVGSEGTFPLDWRFDADTDSKQRLTASLWGTRELTKLTRDVIKTPMVIGGLRRDDTGRIKNAAVHIAADGTFKGHYDKHILVPFSEYMPGREWFPQLENAVKGIASFWPGDTPCRFEVLGEVLACAICYEHAFADYTRAQAADSTMMLNLTIDTWFSEPAPMFHLMMHAPRAVELGTPMMRSALTGISAVIDIDGTVTQSLGRDVQGIIDARVPLRDITPPYRVIGPLFRHLCLALGFALIVATWWRRRRQRRYLATGDGRVDEAVGPENLFEKEGKHG